MRSRLFVSADVAPLEQVRQTSWTIRHQDGGRKQWRAGEEFNNKDLKRRDPMDIHGSPVCGVGSHARRVLSQYAP